MFSLWTRVNAVFFYAVTVLLCLASGSAVTTLWLESTPIVNRLAVNRLLTLRGQQESLRRPDVQDRAIITFDLDADLTGVFNWNVKQLFVYISASYPSESNSFNEVVIWDRVINRTADARLLLAGVYNKYPLVDQRAELKGAPVTLSLSWDVMPITGLLKKTSVVASRVRMPTQYCTEAACTVEAMPATDKGGVGRGAAAARGAQQGAGAEL